MSRLSTPLVLATSSSMIAIGAVAALTAKPPTPPPETRLQRMVGDSSELYIDDRTPETTAESFLDAWRRRAWHDAERIAVGEALEEVRAKRRIDLEMNEEERRLAQEIWDRLSSARLRVLFRRNDNYEDGRIALQGVAAYEFLGDPYRREMEWLLAPEGDHWRVERMVSGRIITPLPGLVEGNE